MKIIPVISNKTHQGVRINGIHWNSPPIHTYIHTCASTPSAVKNGGAFVAGNNINDT